MRRPRAYGFTAWSAACLLLWLATCARGDAGTLQGRPQGPELPTDATWTGVYLICVLGLFLSAGVIRWAVRANRGDLVPTARERGAERA
jgi:hypothetical protein